MTNMHPIHALIVAAGRGSRFGSQIPKQYLTIQDKTVLEYSVASLQHTAVDGLTLVLADDDVMAVGLKFEFDKPIRFVTGGSERFLSVLAGVTAIRQSGAGDDDWVLIHDAARPCLTSQALDEIIHQTYQLQDEVGVILAVPVADTLKLVQDNHICHTVSRQGLWQAQTPQIFRLKCLEEMLQAVLAQGLNITDEASGFEMLGQKVKIVMGSRTNIKLTYLSDKALVEMILAGSKK